MDGAIVGFFFKIFFFSSDSKIILLSTYIVISMFKCWSFYIALVGRRYFNSEENWHVVLENLKPFIIRTLYALSDSSDLTIDPSLFCSK